ncbi:MAG: phage major capsid protein [Litorimonas sp.]
MSKEALMGAAAFLPSAKPVALVGHARADASSIDAKFIELNQAFAAFRDKQTESLEAKADKEFLQAQADQINETVGKLQAEVEAMAKANAAKAVGADGRELRDAEYSEAFASHVRRGDVQANLNKGAADEGGYLAPVEWDRTITDQLVEVSAMREIATVQTIGTAGYKKLFNLRGTGSGWVGETTVRPETSTATFGEMTITTGEIYANPAATQQLLDDAEVNIEAWLAGEVQTEFAKQEGQAFISGDGVNKPRGFLTFAAGAANAGANPLGPIAVDTAAAQAAVTEDELLDLIYGVKSSYTNGARFVMNRSTMGTVRKLRDGDGRQLWQPATTAGQPSSLLAYPLTELPDMPNMAAGATPIAFGNFQRAYTIVDRAGVRVLRDPYTNKPYVMFYTTKRVGGAVTDPQGLRILKMAA